MSQKVLVPKDYLGDAVYAVHDGYQMILTTSDGIEDTNTICFDPYTLKALEGFMERIKAAIKENQ